MRTLVRFHLRRFEAWAISFTPLCLCLSEETVTVVGPFYLVSMPREVKDHKSSVMDSLTLESSKISKQILLNGWWLPNIKKKAIADNGRKSVQFPIHGARSLTNIRTAIWFEMAFKRCVLEVTFYFNSLKPDLRQ